MGMSPGMAIWPLSSQKGVISARSTSLGTMRTIRGDQGHLMRGERIASQSEVFRAIVSGCSPCFSLV